MKNIYEQNLWPVRSLEAESYLNNLFLILVVTVSLTAALAFRRPETFNSANALKTAAANFINYSGENFSGLITNADFNNVGLNSSKTLSFKNDSPVANASFKTSAGEVLGLSVVEQPTPILDIRGDPTQLSIRGP